MTSLLHQFPLRAEAEICLSLFQQAFGVFAINRKPVALPVRPKRPADVRSFIPVDAKPLQIIQKLVLVAGLAALEIGVFDAEDHRALGFAGEEPVVKCGAGVADVQLPGGRRRKTNAYLGILTHTLMLARAGRASYRRRLPIHAPRGRSC